MYIITKTIDTAPRAFGVEDDSYEILAILFTSTHHAT